jgi:hypothetical protein
MIESSLAYTETGRVQPCTETGRLVESSLAHRQEELLLSHRQAKSNLTHKLVETLSLNGDRYEADLSHKHVEVN